MVVFKVGLVAYKLQLLESFCVHLIFHVSQLEKALGADHIQSTLPSKLKGDKPDWFPEDVLT